MINLEKITNNFVVNSFDENFLIKKESVNEMKKINKLCTKIINLNKNKNKSINSINKCQKLIQTSLDQGISGEVQDIFSIKTREDYLHAVKRYKGSSVRRSMLGKKEEWSNISKNPYLHPEWPLFQDQMKKHHLNVNEIKELWQETIKGIDYQLDLNKTGKKHDDNPHYIKLASLLGDKGLLAVPKDKFSLWCGGYEVSLHAQEKGFSTLEKTIAGNIFDKIALYQDWSPLGPLWNNLSSEYAKSSEGAAHIFFRIHDPASVLERQEINELLDNLEKGKVSEIVFHPLINKGAYALDDLDLFELPVLNSKEIQNKIKKDPKISGKETKKLAQTFFKNFLVTLSQEVMKQSSETYKNLYQANKYVIDNMKID